MREQPPREKRGFGFFFYFFFLCLLRYGLSTVSIHVGRKAPCSLLFFPRRHSEGILERESLCPSRFIDVFTTLLSLSLSLFLSSDAFVSHFSAGCYDFPYVRGKLSTSFVRMPREGREGGETRTNTETISFINRELAEASKTTGFSLVISALVPLPDRLIIRFARAKIVPVCTRNKFTCSVSPGVSRVCTLFVTFPFFFFSRTFRME